MANENDATPGLAQIAAAATTLAGVFAAVAFTGVLARTWRNELEWTLAAFALVLVAAVLWALSRRKGWAFVLFAIGVIVGIFAVGKTYSESEKPAITASVDENLVLDGVVRVAGLSSDKQLAAEVQGFRRKPEADSADDGWEAFTIYEASFGPNADGVAEHVIHLRVPPGTYELVRIRARVGDTYARCPLDAVRVPGPAAEAEAETRRTLRTGCFVLALPRLAPFPRVRARRIRRGGEDTLAVRVLSENTPHRVLVGIVVVPGWRPLTRALLMPDPDGKVDERITVRVPRATRTLCAVARWYHPESPTASTLRCPPESNDEATWVVLTAPRRAGR
jgi:hypothetical protein